MKTLAKVAASVALLAIAWPVAANCDDGDEDSDCGAPPEREERLEREDERREGENTRSSEDSTDTDCEGAF